MTGVLVCRSSTRKAKERGYSNPVLVAKYEQYLGMVKFRHEKLAKVEAQIMEEIKALLMPTDGSQPLVEEDDLIHEPVSGPVEQVPAFMLELAAKEKEVANPTGEAGYVHVVVWRG